MKQKQMVLLALNYNCSNKKKMSQFEKKITQLRTGNKQFFL